MALYIACVKDVKTGKLYDRATGVVVELRKVLDLSKCATPLRADMWAYPTVAQAVLSQCLMKPEPQYTVQELLDKYVVLRIHVHATTPDTLQHPLFGSKLTNNTFRVDSVVASALVKRCVMQVSYVAFHNGVRATLKHGLLHSVDSNSPALVRPDEDTSYWYDNGLLHRGDDLPSVVSPDGVFWYKHGVAHRDGDRPQSLFSHGLVVWVMDGKLHRENDRPAVMTKAGVRKWLRLDKLHREGDKPAVTSVTGGSKWFLHNALHREGDQPAVVSQSGLIQKWYCRGKLHREGDKPAVLITMSHTFKAQWFRHGVAFREFDRPTTITNHNVCWENGAGLHRRGGRPAAIRPDGKREWWVGGKRHRSGDLPAVISHNGASQSWYRYNEKHRDNDNPCHVALVGRQHAFQWARRGILTRPGFLPVWDSSDTVAFAHDSSDNVRKLAHNSNIWGRMRNYLLLQGHMCAPFAM